MKASFRSLLLIGAVGLWLCGCASDSGNYGGGITEVLEISSDDATIPLGDGGVVRFNFAFDENEVFDDNKEVMLVVKLPRQLQYRANSAEIDKVGSRDRDVDPRVRTCANGDSYLIFTLGESQLKNANPPADGDAQLKMTLDGEKAGRLVSMEAAADDNFVPYGCNDTFDFDEQEVVNVG